MKPSTKRVLMTRMTDKDRMERDNMDMRATPYRGGGGYNDRAGVMAYGGDMRMGYYPSYGGYDDPAEMRRGRDSRGRYTSMRNEYNEPDMRQRRDSRGRYTSARSEYRPAYNGGMDGMDGMENHIHPYVPPMYETYGGENAYDGYESEERPRMNKIGFNLSGEMERMPEVQHDYRSDATYPAMNEMERREAMAERGYARSDNVPPMTEKMAMEWTSRLVNEDGTKGPHWSMETIKRLMGQKKMSGNPVDLFLAMNLTYSDLCKEFERNGISNIDAYLDFATAFWLNDEDIRGDKLSKYYHYMVE